MPSSSSNSRYISSIKHLHSILRNNSSIYNSIYRIMSTFPPTKDEDYRIRTQDRRRLSRMARKSRTLPTVRLTLITVIRDRIKGE